MPTIADANGLLRIELTTATMGVPFEALLPYGIMLGVRP
jgi:hypothetical protein